MYQSSQQQQINSFITSQLMRVTELELADFNKQYKPLNFSQISPDIQKNVLRLLCRQNADQDSSSKQRQSLYCWLYIDPLSVFALLWNMVFIIVFYIVQLQISLNLAFGPNFFDEELALPTVKQIFFILVPIYFAIDIFLSFFRGFYSFGRGRVIDDQREIVSHYLKTQFHFDIIVFIVYIIPLIHVDFYLNFLQFIPAGLIWIKKFKYQSQIINYLQYQPTARIIFTLVVLFSDVLMMGNYGACIFIAIDLLLYNAQYYGSNTAYYWMTNNTSYPLSIITGPWYYQYIYAQEFSTGTLSTLAPGPFAKNPIQAVYAIIACIFFMVLASYVGDVLVQVVTTFQQRRIFHEENIISFDNFMQLKEVSTGIRDRIYNFFELIWEVQLKMQSKQQQELIEKLPKYLKQQLLLQMGFAKSIYFLNYLPQQIAMQKIISFKFQRITIDSNTCLFETQKRNIQNRNLYYIKQGMAKFYIKERITNDKYGYIIPNKEKILNLSNVERILGVYQFITGQDYTICCKSIDLCLLQKLSYANFNDILQELGIWQQFKELQSKILINKELKLINKVCVLCLQQHIESQCPELYVYHRVKNQMIQSGSFGKEQKRRAYQRRKFTTSKRMIERQNFQQKMKNTSIFSMFKGINLGKLILDINKLNQIQFQMMDQAKNYNGYYTDYNL